MPDWLAPYHIPKLTDAEYAKAKAEYIAKNGYTITIPGLSDIIKIRTVAPMTQQEHDWWRGKRWERFGPQRLEELKREKKKRYDRYQAMLGSPTPAIVTNAGSIMTAIDDAQDATISLAVLGQLARKIAPKLVGKLLRGPVGVLTATSDLMNLVQAGGMFCMAPMYGKKAGEQLSKASPKNLKAKLKGRFNMKAKLPDKSDMIQVLQTTDQVFGFGLSLGPIVGLVQDIFFGAVRSTPGTTIKVKFPIPKWGTVCAAAQKALKATSFLLGFRWGTDDEEMLSWITGAALAFQHLNECNQLWNPLEMVDSFDNLEVQAPRPWHSLTQEVIGAEPLPLDSVIGWPQTGNEWSPMLDVLEDTQEIATDNLNRFLTRNKHSWSGFVGGLAACEASTYALSTLEGEEDVYYDYTVQMKASITMLKHGYMLDPAQPYSKLLLFQSYLDECEVDDWNPTMEQILAFCGYSFNDIRLLQTIPATT